MLLTRHTLNPRCHKTCEASLPDRSMTMERPCFLGNGKFSGSNSSCLRGCMANNPALLSYLTVDWKTKREGERKRYLVSGVKQVDDNSAVKTKVSIHLANEACAERFLIPHSQQWQVSGHIPVVRRLNSPTKIVRRVHSPTKNSQRWYGNSPALQ